jgi:integrase
MDTKRIGLRDIVKLNPEETLWDSAVAGFGVRRQKGTAVSYILKFRTKQGRQRWLTIGRHGSPWTPEQAREEAKRILGEVVIGEDPSVAKSEQRKAMTVSELCDQYFSDAETGRLLTRRKIAKRPSTIESDRGRIERHIKPLLGSLKVIAVTRADVEKFMHDVAEGKTSGRSKSAKKRGLSLVRGGKGAASRTTGLLGAIFSYAIKKNLRQNNPVHGIIRFADGRKLRRLSNDEYRLLGQALERAELDGMWPPAIAVTRFLAVTGWRSGEGLGLKWKDIDLERRTASLPDSKTGLSMRPLSLAACEILKTAKVMSIDDFVFPSKRGTGKMNGFGSYWEKIAAKTQIPPDVTPHTFRHSFSSLGDDLGYSEITIGAIIGHKSNSITSRYIHKTDAVLLSAADAIAEETARLMAAQD